MERTMESARTSLKEGFPRKKIKLPDLALHMLMQDSAPQLVDWVLHHRALGIEAITVHGDGANTQATKLAQALADAGLITFSPTNRPGLANARSREISVQEKALQAETDARREYFLWLQPDDFLVIDAGEGRLEDLVAGLSTVPDLISLTMQIAGGSGQARFADAPLPTRFTRGTGGATGPLFLGVPLRTIFRPGMGRALQTARPKLKAKYIRRKEPVTWLNGAGEDVAERYLEKGWLAMPDKPGLGLAHVISFMAQDKETFLLRHTGSGETLPFMTPEHLKGTIQRYYKLNFAMAEMGPFGAGPQDLQETRAAFMAGHPEIARLHAEVIAEFSGRLERLLAVQDPKAAKIVAAFLAGANITLDSFDWPVPFGAHTTPPILSEAQSAWAERLVRTEDQPEAEEEAEEQIWADADDGPDSETPAPARADKAVIAAPAWLSDLRLSGQAHGFYHSMPNYACTYVARSREHLLISFDNLASVRENPVSRQPWGYDFVRKENWSHLGVLSYVPGWFRDVNLHTYLRSLRDSGFFEQFEQVTMFGTSMGGYGAAAFSSLAPGCRVAAFSPQSTLSPRLAGWDPRYPTGKRADWAGHFSDAAEEARSASQVWLFYDPAVPMDRRHVERFTSPNVVRVPLRYADHKTALMLRNGRVLSAVMRDIATGKASLATLMKHYRACRTLPDYVEGLRARAQRSGGASRLARLERALKQIG